METSTHAAPPVPLARLVGRLVQAGHLRDTHGDTVHGVLIDCGKTVLQSVKLPLYQYVQVMHFHSTTEEILEYLDAGIPAKTLREVYERLRAELEPTRIHTERERPLDATAYSSSEYACQYWHEPNGWRESSIYETEAEAVSAHDRIQKAFPACRYRVLERATTERVICETNADVVARAEQPTNAESENE
jgi:hypothetical protein